MMQKEAWEKEYRSPNLASSTREGPSHALLRFLESVEKPLVDTQVVELGCGNGRNLIFLAQQGAICTGIDFIPKAIEQAQAKVVDKNLKDKVTLMVGDISRSLPFRDGQFDIALDFLSGSTLLKDSWAKYEEEVQRTLKNGGYLVVYYYNADSPEHWVARKESPEKERNSIIHPTTGMIEYAFTKDDLVAEFNSMRPVVIDTIEFSDTNYGQSRDLSFVFGVFQKGQRA